MRLPIAYEPKLHRSQIPSSKLAELNWFKKVEIGPKITESRLFCIFVQAAKEVKLNFRVASTESCSDLRCHMDFPVCCELSFNAVSLT